MDEMVSMKVFKILVITLALCLGGLFVITLSTNSKISDLGIDIRGMTKDIATNSRDIKSNTGDLRLLMRKYRIEPTERNGEKQ
ncbi:MAG: hypothetical protein V1897_16890, partial [Pseudomonadota bacterium]